MEANPKTIEKTLNYKGHEVYYEIRGEAEKTLVFIHGWSSNIDVWKFQLDAFPNYKVIAVDLPGHGKSSKNPELEYSIELLANSINEILKTEEIEDAFVLGHSMGFSIAEVFCYQYPEKCVGLGCIDGAHFELPEDEVARNEWIAFNNMMANTMNEEKGREEFINMLFLEGSPKILRREIIKSSKDVPLAIGQTIISSVTEKLEFWEKRVVEIPCLAIHSPVYNLSDEYKNNFLKMYPQAEYHTIEDVSHFLMLEIPYKINQMIHDYLVSVY